VTRPRKPWADRAPVEPVTHEPQPSGLLDAWEQVPVTVCDTLCGEMVSGAVVDRSRPCAVCGWMDEPRLAAVEVG